jgi:hypothetical protein
MLLYIAWQIWQLKYKLGVIIDRLNKCERAINNVLYTAPEIIYTGQQQIYELRQKHQNLKLQIQQVRQILNFILLGRRMLQRYSR